MELTINDYFAQKTLAPGFPFHRPRMKGSRSKREDREKGQPPRHRGYRALCCSRSCRLSVSSTEEAESSSSERFASISSLAHAMVQERLDLMIRERHAERERRRQRSGVTKFIVMVAMHKTSDDPREDFRESMTEMITANRIEDPKDLRSLLNYYVSMNREEYYSTILEVFYDVCTDLFLSRKRR